MSTKFILSRKSNYLKSIFDPSIGAYSNPDDRIVRHTCRSETLTANLIASSDGGIIIFYPCSTSFEKGWHYTYNATTSAWTLQSVISIAQDLSLNYNYARQTAFSCEIRSSTQSTSNAILSGNLNAATYEGSGLSELELQGRSASQIYNTILASTTNVLDKVGSVYVADGLQIVALPNDASVPYQRLRDATPSSIGPTGNYVDSANSTSLIVSGITATLTTAATTISQFNADIGICASTFTINCLSSVGTTLTATVNLLNAFGQIITTGNLTTVTPVNSVFSTVIIFEPQPQPICAVQIRYSALAATTINSCDVIVDIKGGAQYGTNSPITLAVYQGMLQGNIITVGGYANFELVPNTALLRQIETNYGPYDKHEFDYILQILSMRKELQLRSVMDRHTYRALLAMWKELGDLDSNLVAEAFDIGSLIKGIKKIAVPALSSIFPQYAPVINMADQAADVLLANAASGRSISYASDLPSDMDLMLSDDSFSDLEVSRPVIQSDKIGTRTLPMPHKVAFFPVVVTNNGSPSEMRMYAALEGDHRNMLSDSASMLFMKSGLNCVYGAESSIPIPLKNTYTLVQVESKTVDSLNIPTDAPIVMGTSWQAAVYTLESSKNGVFPVAITGGVSRDKKRRPIILENPAFPLKNAYCHKIGIPMIGVDMGGQSKLVSHVATRMGDFHSKPAIEFSSIKLTTPLVKGRVAWAMDNETLKLEDLDLDGPDKPLISAEKPLDTTDTLLDDIETELKKPAIQYQKVDYKKLIAPETSMPAVLSTIQQAETAGTVPSGTTAAFSWIINTGLVPTMEMMSKIDKVGTMTHRVLKPLYEVSSKGGDKVSPAANMYMRAERLYEVLKRQYRDISVDWILQNGTRGPDDAQAKHFRNFGELPPPAEFQGSLLQRPSNKREAREAYEGTEMTLGVMFDKKIERMMKSDQYATPWLRSRLAQFAIEKSRLPTTEELKWIKDEDPNRQDLVDQFKEAKVAKKAATKAVPRLPPDQETKLASQVFKNVLPTSTKRSSRLLSGLQRANGGMV